MPNDVTCPDCGGEMERGFIPDNAYLMVAETYWHKGPPETKKNIFGMASGVRLNLTDMIPISAHRCLKCGLLKLYAQG